MSSGKVDETKGRVKEAVGSLTGSEHLKADGRADQRSGKTQRNIEKMSAQVKGLVDDAADKAAIAIDKTKAELHQK